MSDTIHLCRSEWQARRLRQEYNQTQRQQGRAAWSAPQILSLDRFLRDSWLRSWPSEQLLSPAQEQCLWQQALEAQDMTHISSPRQLAEQCQRSYALAQEWQIDWRSGPCWSAEQKLFRDTAQAVEDQTAQQNCLTTAQLPTLALDRLTDSRGGGSAPKLRLLDQAPNDTPLRRHVLASLRRQGAEDCADDEAQPALSLNLCSEDSQQWALIAEDLRAKLINDPDKRIVIALPQLNPALCQKIHLLLQEYLDPGRLLEQKQPQASLWRFEPSDSLLDQPAVQAACSVLRLQARENRFSDLSAFLLHPRLFSVEERLWTASIEARLREQGGQLGIGLLLGVLPREAPSTLRDKLKAFIDLIRQSPRRGSCLDWLEHWQQRWQSLAYATRGQSWPLGEEFDQALLQFAGLQVWLPSLSAPDALGWLEQILRRQRYQESEAHRARIQIATLDTAIDLPADEFILANFSQDQIPAGARPDPFLRLDDQLAAGLPSASPDTQLQQARKSLVALQQRGLPLRVYCSILSEQGVEQLPCPLLGNTWLTRHYQSPNISESQARRPSQDPVPALSEERQAQQKGGVKIVQSQAHGPFFAFARHRLGLRGLPKPQQGLSAIAQGQWIHAVLEDFWKETRDQDRLLSRDEASLQEELRERVQQYAAHYLPVSQFSATLQQAEADRVLRCCLAWLGHEKRRLDPFTVLHCEARLEESMGPLSFELRLDRLDRCETAQGPRYLIMDYKTSRQLDEKFWSTQQLFEPQLPLYACSESLRRLDIPHVDGICFAQVQESQPAFVASLNWRKRLIEDDKKAHHIDWEQKLADWRERLDELIHDYCAGGNTVDFARDYRSRYPVADLLGLIDDSAEEQDDD